MDTKNKRIKLFEEFPEIGAGEWKKKVISDLRGDDFERKLVWKTPEGFPVLPYYRSEDTESFKHTKTSVGEFPYIRGLEGSGNRWHIRQNILVGTQPQLTNKKILTAIQRGATAIGIRVSGIETITVEFLSSLLSDIDLHKVEIHFTGVGQPALFYDLILNTLRSMDFDPILLKGSLGIDPVGTWTLSGNPDEDELDRLAELTKTAQERTPNFRTTGVNPHLFQDSGSTLVQELAYGISVANEYVDQLTSRGVAADAVAKSILFTFATGPNYFMEIAKLRAARWLWSVICKAWGIPENHINLDIHAQTASWNVTVYDPYVNVLRGTTEAMSASLGGANTISVNPFDLFYSDENEFSGRVSRNTQIILKEEAYFDKVSDPAAGSYYIETLTDSLAEQAWELFKNTDHAGGYLESLKAGIIQQQIERSRSTKKEGAASRRESILGVNQYPNFNEMVLEKQVKESPVDSPENTAFKPLSQFRISEEFEQLRLATERSGKRPRVFLLKIGDSVWRSSRAMFAGNFFAVAGYEIIDRPGFKTVDEGIAAAIAAKSDIVVLCSSDDNYPEIGPVAFDKIEQKAEIVIAGYPKNAIEGLKSKGLKHFISVKSNLLDELIKFQTILKII